MKFTPIELRTFATIIDVGGISAAARKLGMPKSSVSRELAVLEERLGTRLIQRTTRSLSLTHAGEVLLSYARRIVEELENAEAAVEALRETPRGNLSVTVPYAFARFILAPRLALFRARYPELRISINPTIRVLDLIEEGVDVAIRIGEIPPSSMVARKLAEIPLILVASTLYARAHGLPDSPEQLTAHSLIDLTARATETMWRLQGRRGEAAQIQVTPRLAIAEPSILLDLAEQGLGIAVAPHIYAATAIGAGRLIRVLPEYVRGQNPIHAVYPSRRLLTPKVRAFIDFASECLGRIDGGDSPKPEPANPVEQG